MPPRNLTFLLLATAGCLAAWTARDRDAAGRRFADVLAVVDRNALDPVAGDVLFDAAVDAVIGRLDEHSAFVRGDEQAKLEAALDQQFAGVGLELAIDSRSGFPVVVAPIVGSPAWRARVRPGTLVAAIDGTPLAGRPLRDAVRLLRGPAGAPVSLGVVPPADHPTADPTAPPPSVTEIVLVREIVRVESIRGDRRRDDGGWQWRLEAVPDVALVRITSFGEHTVEDLDRALEEIVGGEVPLRGIVLDLRGNPGGLVTAAVEVCDRFLDEGTIVTTRGRRTPAAGDVRRATAGSAAAGVPLAVLVDGLTASAAEIVAAGLQDNGRAVVAGSRTFGKATVQTLLPLEDGRGLLKLTTAEYIRPAATPLHRRPDAREDAAWGVMPDRGYEVTPPAEVLERLRDWRRSRDLPLERPLVATVSDPALDLAVASFGPAASAAADFGGQEEAAGDADQTATTRE